MPLHRNHKTSSQRKCKLHTEGDKTTSSCLLFKNKSNNFILFYQKSAYVHAVPGCCNYPGHFWCSYFPPIRLNISIDRVIFIPLLIEIPLIAYFIFFDRKLTDNWGITRQKCKGRPRGMKYRNESNMIEDDESSNI